MWSFFTPKPQSNFEKSKFLIVINSLLTELFNKEIKFKETALANGAQSMEYRKYIILNNLCDAIRSIKKQYNEIPEVKIQEDNEELLNTIQKLTHLISQTLINYETTLSIHRNQELRETIKYWLDNATIGGAVAGGFFFGYPLTTLFALSVFQTDTLFKPFTNAVHYLTGLDSKRKPRTLEILIMLQAALIQSVQNLGLEQSYKKAIQSDHLLIGAFYCPITLQPMKDPVICYDGFTYEREAITKHFELHKKSPMTREPLNGRTLDEALKPNRALKDAITEYASKNPSFMEQCYEPPKISCLA